MLQEFVKSNKDMIADMINDMHTAIPGFIVSYDAATNLAVVQPSAQVRDNKGQKITYPQIADVPVVLMQSAAQTAVVAFPIKPGDGCLILFAEKALDFWKYGRETPTDLKFDLTNAIAIPGLFVEANPVMREASVNDALIVWKDEGFIRIKQDEIAIERDASTITLTSDGITITQNDASITVANGRISIIGEVVINGNVTVTGSIDATGDVAGINTSLHTHVHGGIYPGGNNTSPPVQ